MKHSLNFTSMQNSAENLDSIAPHLYSAEFESCFKWRIYHHEYQKLENKTIIQDLSNLQYDKGEYMETWNGSLIVCIPLILQPSLYFLDYIGFSVRLLSILSLVLSITVDFVVVLDIRRQRLRPIICHKISLLLFYAGSTIWNVFFCDRAKCESNVFSIIFLYFERSAYCWINVISFDMWRTFNPVAILRRPTFVSVSRTLAVHRFTCQCVYAFGVPAILVGIGYLLSLLPLNLHKEWFHFGVLYHNFVQVVFMTASVCLILLANCVFCALIIRNLQVNHKSNSQHVLSASQTKEMFGVYLKLVVVSGFLLIFFQLCQFFIVYQGGYFLPRLAFDWLANAQGLWLFLIYSCNEPVRKHGKKKLAQFFHTELSSSG